MTTNNPLLSIRRRHFLAASALAAAVPGVLAQTVPRTAHIVVGFSPGGAADAVARLLSEKLRGGFAPAVIVENRVGAAARIAVDYVRLAPADGTAMLFVPDAVMFLYPHVYKALNYDVFRDFTPVTRVIGMSLAMFAGPGLPDKVKTVSDYVAWVKANPKQAVYGTPAAGATPHFTGAILNQATGLDMTPVHYKGGAPGILELAGGQIPVFFGSIADGIQLVNAGKIRSLATSGAQRSPFLPNVPTFAEQGYQDLVVEDGLGLYVPSKTPADVVTKLNAAVLEALKTKELVDGIQSFGFEVAGEPPPAFAARLKRELGRWGPIVKRTGFTAME